MPKPKIETQYGETFYADLANRIEADKKIGLTPEHVKLIWVEGLKLLTQRAKERVAICFVGWGTFKPGFRKGGPRKGLIGKNADGSLLQGTVQVPDRHFLTFDDGSNVTEILNP